MMLVLIASIYIGFAIADDPIIKNFNGGLNMVLAVGFLLFAIIIINKTPRIALRYLAIGFIAHTIVDLLHGMTLLSLATMPNWYAYLCAIYDLGCAILCTFPIVFRLTDKHRLS